VPRGGKDIMSYQQPPEDPFQQQSRPSSAPTYSQDQPPYTPQQGQQPSYQPPQESYRGQAEVQPAGQGQQGYRPQDPHHGHRSNQGVGKKYALRGAESFWYVLGCIGFGAAYFAKLPVKKAACEIFSELQLDGQGPSRGYSLRGAEGFWYVLMCLPFGAGYFAKVSAKKALWEGLGMIQSAPGEYAAAVCRVLSGSGPAAPHRPR
jgi:hypothetical protein